MPHTDANVHRINTQAGPEHCEKCSPFDITTLPPGTVVLITTLNSEYFFEITKRTAQNNRVLAAGGVFQLYGQVDIKLDGPYIRLGKGLNFTHNLLGSTEHGWTTEVQIIDVAP